jgi:hypothetical protein
MRDFRGVFWKPNREKTIQLIECALQRNGFEAYLEGTNLQDGRERATRDGVSERLRMSDFPLGLGLGRDEDIVDRSAKRRSFSFNYYYFFNGLRVKRRSMLQF